MNPLNWSFRTALFVAAAICGGLLGFAYYSQFKMNLEPCPLCIFQRIAVIAVLLVCLVGAVHNPGPTGRRVYGLLGAVAAFAGISVAGRHVWIQHLPPNEVPECGPGLGYMLENLPVATALKKAFTGSGECAKVDWKFLSLSMPEWTLILFVAFVIGAFWYGFRRYGS